VHQRASFSVVSLASVALVTLAACGSDKTTNPLDPSLADLGTMQVGAVRTIPYSVVASHPLTIPANLSSAQYLIVAANTTVNTDVIPQLTASGDQQGVFGQNPAAQIAPPGSTHTTSTYTSTGGALGATIEGRLRAYERTTLARRAQRRTTGISRDVLTPSRSVAPAVGDQMTLRTLTATGFDGTTDVCNAYTTTTGTVQAVSTHAIVVLDNRSVNNGFTATDYQNVANEFDQVIYPTDVGYFGTPTDIDGNGHVIIYYTPSVNLLTPQGSAATTGYVGGFFFAGDMYPTTGTNSCPSSNTAEIFYLLAPDPGGTYGNVFSPSFVQNVTRGTVAHEFQHMINSGNRYVNNNLPFEVTWLDEGLAHFAEDAVGRAEAGFTDLQTLTVADIGALDASTQSAFFIQNFGRAKYYVQRPDTTGAIVSASRASQNLASRGAEWLMLRYAADWFSNNTPRNLTKALAAGPDTGTTNLAKQIGVPLDTLFARWLVALYTDHMGIPNLDAQYNYKSYDMRSLVSRTPVVPDTGPAYIAPQALGNGSTSITIGVPPSSAAYFLTSLTTGGARTISVTSTGSSLSTNGRFYIVRTQ